MGVGLRPRTKVLDEPPDPTAHASEIYPDCCKNILISSLVSGPGREAMVRLDVFAEAEKTVILEDMKAGRGYPVEEVLEEMRRETPPASAVRPPG